MNRHDEDTKTLNHLPRDVATRATMAVGLAAIGVIHLLDSIGKYGETRRATRTLPAPSGHFRLGESVRAS